jgi:hypothetical protein
VIYCCFVPIRKLPGLPYLICLLGYSTVQLIPTGLY